MKTFFNLQRLNQKTIFKMVTDFVTSIVLYILLLALIVGVLNILVDIKSMFFGSSNGGFAQIVSGVLTIFVLIDLFKTFVDYREHEEIRITYVTDATILIVMREIAVGVYVQRFDYQFILGMSILLLTLGVIRALAVKYPPIKSSHQAIIQ
ncbi:phosphate-starvation-inducible PsiE family protein [uncultured Methanolobus sp.]|uniref:phosphate-starvation-inducible PsiE family protein n=1 Tax=uncultured Methanolobus sp. TaxID=218300 RepID=UPI002AABCD70|nr:phosphate-starvation-inducible PsiE family protein [uncultured Methanolobus sp.]